MRWNLVRAVALLVMGAAAAMAQAARQPVLQQIDLPHAYYFREMLLPQLTSGPSGVAFAPDGGSLVYSMAGSLWRQAIGEDTAVELTHGPGYDYQPDWSPDGRHIAFVRHHRNAIEIWQLDLQSGEQRQLTRTDAVNLTPRYSPDGSKLAFVSTAGSGHFNLFVARPQAMSAPQPAVPARTSAIDRYYYSVHDNAIDPSWTPDGKQLVFVANHEIAYGSGSICRAVPGSGDEPRCFIGEETSWRAQPEVSPDGKRVLYSSYQGRQWHQLWLTTPAGDPALPLTFGDFDITQARWSKQGDRIAYISNELGNTSLWVQAVVGGKRLRVEAKQRKYLQAMFPLRIEAASAEGQSLPVRLSVVGADRRFYGPDDQWMHADDGFDPQRQREETRYFHCQQTCVVMVPAGDATITAWHGQRYAPAIEHAHVSGPASAQPKLSRLTLPAWAPHYVSADLHVHMNYGGHYRHTLQTLADQARAEDLDVIYNTIVNKEQRVPDIAQFSTTPFVRDGQTIFQAQEYHTSFWGHMGLLGLDDHYITPGFSAYQHSGLASPYPYNAVIADLAHEQHALVGYVHPYDWNIEPSKEQSLTHELPADVAMGKVDYLEVVGFSDHKSTAAVWYRLLNLGFRLPAGAGTDAMANYASLRGPVGMNRVYLDTGGARTADALRDALQRGRTFASNGPTLAFQVEGKSPGDVLQLSAGRRRLHYRAAVRSIAPLDHVEIVHNGRVVASHRFGGQRTSADLEGNVTVDGSGWLVLRAWKEGADPLIFDLYPYATTSPVYIEVGARPLQSPADAAYFVAWLDRVIAAAEARADYNTPQEKRRTVTYLQEARARYADMQR